MPFLRFLSPLLVTALSVFMLVTSNADAKEKLLLVPNQKVCMVTNMVFPRDQIPVKQAGKTYYGCCENCKKTLAEDPSARTAFDPISKKMVDKASAIIGARPDGSVVYFENKSTFKQYTQ